MRRFVTPALLAVTLALTACGDHEREAATTSAADGASKLTVKVTGAGSGKTIEVGCPGHAACARLDALVAEARRDDRVCTAQYGGPEKARVTGRLAGDRVDVTIDRSDGCGIADYDRLFEILGSKPPLAG